MKRYVFLLLLALPIWAQTQIWKGTGFAYTRTMPTHNPTFTGAWVAIDTTSGDWYEWDLRINGWREMGERIQLTYTTGVPTYTPQKQRSRLALNTDGTLYAYQAGVWTLLNPSTTGGFNQSFTLSGDTLKITDAGGTLSVVLPVPADTSGYNQSLYVNGDTLFLLDGSGLLYTTIPAGLDTSGYNQSLLVIGDTIKITDAQGTLWAILPASSDTSGYNQSFVVSGDTLTLTDGAGSLSVVLPADTSGYNVALSVIGDTLKLTDGAGTLQAILPMAQDTSGYNQSLTYTSDTLWLQDGSGTLYAVIPNSDTSGYNYSLTISGDTLTVTDGAGTLSAVLPATIDTSGYNQSLTVSGDTIRVTDGAGSVFGILPPSTDTSGYNQSLTFSGDTLRLQDGAGMLSVVISSTDTSGYNQTLQTIGDSLFLTDGYGTLSAPLPLDTSGYNYSMYVIQDTLYLVDGDTTLRARLSIPSFNSNLVFFSTTTPDTVAGYNKMVVSIDDPDYDDPAVDVSTGAITGVAQPVGSLISDKGIIVGHIGLIESRNIGRIRRVSGTGVATFYFELYKRDTLGVETLLATSDETQPVDNPSYVEFFADAVIYDQDIAIHDRIVAKYFANRIPTGSDPVYEFQFGGSQPVRLLFPVEPSLLVNVPIKVGTTSVQDGVQGQYLTTDANGILDQGTITAGLGISISGSPDITISNSAPDQTVTLNQSGIVSLSGTYPTFTISATEVDGSVTNEIQLIDTFSRFSDTISISLSSDAMPAKFIVLPQEIDTSTHLLQDSILSFRSMGVEYLRDTIRTKTYFGSGTTNTLARFSGDTLSNSGVVSNGTQILFDPDLNGAADVTINATQTTVEALTTTGAASIGQGLSIGSFNNSNTDFVAGWTSSKQATGLLLGNGFSYGRGASYDTLKYAVDTSVIATLSDLSDTASAIRSLIIAPIIKEDTTKVQAFSSWPMGTEMLLGVDAADSTVIVYDASAIVQNYEVDGDVTNEFQTLDRIGNTIRLSDTSPLWSNTSVNVLGGDSTYVVDTSRIATRSWATSTFLQSEVDGSVTNEIQTLSINAEGKTISISGGNSVVIPYDTVSLATFGGGSGAARDTSVFTTSAIYGSFYNDGTDTLVITEMQIGLQGTSPSVVATVIYNDTLNVTGTPLVTAGTTATNTAGGTNVITFDNAKIPPANWVWAKTTTVTTKPTYLSITIIGYRKRKI